mmetsp:Transcript_1001/g.2560  ORF Transcript_1001/g.2560 Transcript_1001/m.2560 type:complete len:437 (+) Transcript_1001:81-1391(+)
MAHDDLIEASGDGCTYHIIHQGMSVPTWDIGSPRVNEEECRALCSAATCPWEALAQVLHQPLDLRAELAELAVGQESFDGSLGDLSAAMCLVQRVDAKRRRMSFVPVLPIFDIATPISELDDIGMQPTADQTQDGPPRGAGGLNLALPSMPVDPEATPEQRERRRLCDVLWLAREKWGPKDLVVAEKKLATVQISTVEALADALAEGNLTSRLRDCGVQTFHEDTCKAFQARAQESLKYPDMQLPGLALGTNRKSEVSPKRLLCEVLWASRPSWTPLHLKMAEQKLASAGIDDLPTLDEALEDLNQRLRQAGSKTFGHETLFALRRHLDKAYGRVDTEDKQAAWMRSLVAAKDPSLRDLLWECKPTWSTTELVAVVRKLAAVGVTDVSQLKAAMLDGLNSRLREVGQKTFSMETIGELRVRLGLASIPAGVHSTHR